LLIDQSRDWHPFYLGKAENIHKRINEHCLQEKHKKTFSLKLKHRQYLLENSKLSVSAFTLNNLELKFNDKSALQFVLTNLEKEMRKKINPWIGKQ